MKRHFPQKNFIKKLPVVVLLLSQLCTVTLALQESMGPNGSNALAVHAAGYKGENVHIGFLSLKNVYKDHNAFLEKDSNGYPIPGTSHVEINNVLGISTVFDSHDTQIAGIVLSSGDQIEPIQIGAAPMAFLHNTRAIDDNGTFYPEDALNELIVKQNCSVIVTGFQFCGEPADFDGNGQIARIYDYYAQEYNVIFANAAGNEKTGCYEYSTNPTSPGDCYNGITTGGLINIVNVYDIMGNDSLSGFTYDGRTKPEIAAPSSNQRVPTTGGPSSWTTTAGTTQGFTSWSVPHTAGIAAVLLSYANSPESSEADDNQNEVIKAVIVNSTFPNIRDKSGYTTTFQTWNADRGYGRIDALKAYQTLSGTKVFPGINVNAQKGWAYRSMTQNYQTDQYNIYGLKNERLVLTVTWNRQVTKLINNYNEETAPKFNLDLMIRSPQGTVLFSETETLNNLQKADIILPEEGFYEITLSNTTKKDRSYALAFDLLPPLQGDIDVNYVVDTDDLGSFAQHWMDTGCIEPVPCYLYDFSGNGSIELNDFSILAQNWLDYDGRYYNP